MNQADNGYFQAPRRAAQGAPEAFAASQRGLFERIAAGAPLLALLEGIIRLVEGQAEGMLCSILLLDRETLSLRHGAAPSLPAAYNRLLDGVPIGADTGSCGAAAFRGERVIVSDIESHPYWADYRHFALPHGLLACWSSPIFSPRHELLGTFAMYYRQKRSPTPLELEWVDAATQLASIAIVRDRNEEERHSLVRELGERVKDLERSQSELRHGERERMQAPHGAQYLRALSTLAGGIAHDFNNLLTIISGHVELSLRDLPSDHPACESLGEIRKASRRATDLVARILTFGGQQEPRREALDPRRSIQEALSVLRATLPASIEVRSELAADTPNISADPAQMRQALMNLATNAAHAIGPRAGMIEITSGHFVLARAASEVLPASYAPWAELPAGNYACIRVRDTGSGMDAATLERVFEPFFSTKVPGHGCGLGLSVVHGIMQSHGGAVTVQSKLGVGTTFDLYFPATDAAVEAAASEHPMPARAHGEHVLYVDDEEALVLLATRTLKRMGYRVSGYSSSLLALEEFRARASEFDAVVTDIAMPGLSGVELVRQLREVRPELPVVMTSGYIRPEDTASARSLGVKDIVPKPNTVEDFAEVLRRAISRQRILPPP